MTKKSSNSSEASANSLSQKDREKAEREARVAARLRDNLRRRKAAARKSQSQN